MGEEKKRAAVNDTDDDGKATSRNEDVEPKGKKLRMDDDDGAAPPSPKKRRKRKKKMFKELTGQMEFYFGDANLSKSKYMRDKLRTDGPWIDLDVFLTFNKLADMMKTFFGRLDVHDLYRALTSIHSDLLQVRESPKPQVKRSKEFDENVKSPEEVEKSTVYVENLPPFVTVDSLTRIFSRYGRVAYISLPRYKHNAVVKGFAFVEFHDDHGAENALQKVDRIHDPEPDQLQTVKSYRKERNLDDDDDDVDEEEDTKKRKRRKKAKKNNDPLPAAASDQQVVSLLKIMTKTDWRRLRNKYLNLQKRNMSVAKGRMRRMVEVTKEEETEVKKVIDEALGVIVKFQLDEPVSDNGKALKAQIRAAIADPVKYVDAINGQMQFFVRCSDPNQAETVAGVTGIVGKSGDILAGQEEQDYWDKIRRDRSDKLSGKVKVAKSKRKQRGKDRVVKRFEEQVGNSHKFFEVEEANS